MSTGGGQLTVRSFPFKFNTPGLLTGVTFYRPQAGELLIDAWISVLTAWDGTTPLADIGTFTAHTGLFVAGSAAVDMTIADAGVTGNTGLLTSATGGATLASFNGIYTMAQAYRRIAAPGVLSTTAPLQVVVSQDGTNNGASPASTAGVGVVYIVTAVPLTQPWQG